MGPLANVSMHVVWTRTVENKLLHKLLSEQSWPQRPKLLPHDISRLTTNKSLKSQSLSCVSEFSPLHMPQAIK